MGEVEIDRSRDSVASLPGLLSELQVTGRDSVSENRVWAGKMDQQLGELAVQAG